jgi:TetR/AcrR family transcriptional repressor of nem operon
MSTATPSTRPRHGDATRDALLDVAFDQMYAKGYHASGLKDILAASGLTKGALYHHFGSKLELGYAVVEERVLPLVRERYLKPFGQVEDPVAAVDRMGVRMEEELRRKGVLERGCPLNNLVQEMSGVDEGFRRRLESILEEWRSTIASGLRRGQAEGIIDPDSDPDAAATFIVASLLGAVGFAKNARDVVPFHACRGAVNAYAATLRVEAAPLPSS